MAAQEKQNSLKEKLATIGNLYFTLNSSYLTSTDKNKLNEVYAFLNQHPEIKIELSGHTDSRGKANYNQWLSERRVQRALDYLLAKGINPNRLQIRAFGEIQLTNNCNDNTYCPEEKHKENRRVEIEVKLN